MLEHVQLVLHGLGEVLVALLKVLGLVERLDGHLPLGAQVPRPHDLGEGAVRNWAQRLVAMK